MTPDEERWAEALAVIRMYGEKAEAFITQRRLDLTEDSAGRARWREIADKVRMLRETGARQRH